LSTNCELRSGEPTLLIPRSRKTCKKKKDKDEVYYDRLLPTWNALSRRPTKLVIQTNNAIAGMIGEVFAELVPPRISQIHSRESGVQIRRSAIHA